LAVVIPKTPVVNFGVPRNEENPVSIPEQPERQGWDCLFTMDGKNDVTKSKSK
jgi:hypothetical protein